MWRRQKNGAGPKPLLSIRLIRCRNRSTKRQSSMVPAKMTGNMLEADRFENVPTSPGKGYVFFLLRCAGAILTVLETCTRVTEGVIRKHRSLTDARFDVESIRRAIQYRCNFLLFCRYFRILWILTYKPFSSENLCADSISIRYALR